MNYLSEEEIVAINKKAVKLSNDPHGIMHPSNLSHAAEAIQMKYNSNEDAVILKASFILDYLANKGHVFIEGNKRTAETATILFLRINGLFFEEKDQKELTNFVLSVARNQESVTSISKWLKQRIKTMPGNNLPK